VIAAALGCAFLLMLVLRPADTALLRVAAWLMSAEMLTGIIGFALHLRGNLEQSAPSLWDRFLYGAPIFAPLLFANLAILAGLGMWAVGRIEISRNREGVRQ